MGLALRKSKVSTGCATCRKRKKGCDKNRPECFRCKQAGLRCEGYFDDRIWIHATADTVSDRRRAELQSDTQGRDTGGGSKTPRRDVIIALSSSLARSARDQLYYGAFSSALLPSGSQYSARAVELSFVGWAGLIPQLRESEEALRCVSLAIGTAILSIESQDMQLRIKSLQAYNRAICEVAKAIKQPDWYQRDGLVATGRLLTFYDVLVPAGDRALMLAWKGHHEGTQAMFLARGPYAFVSGPAHQLFIDARINMIILALGKRRRYPFNDKAWKTVPWLRHKKTTKDQLLDCLQEVPGILEQVTAFFALRAVGRRVDELRKRIIAQCEALNLELAAWHEKVFPDILKFDYTAKVPLLEPDNDVEVSLHHLSIIYWISLMILYSIINVLHQQERGQGNDYTESYTSDTSWPNLVNLYASKCVHAMHLYWAPKCGIIENISGLLSLGFILRFYLGKALKGQHNEEMVLLGKTLKIKLFGSDVGSILAKVSAGQLKLDSTSSNRSVPGDDLSWF